MNKLRLIIPCVSCGGQIVAEPRKNESKQEQITRAKNLLKAHQKICGKNNRENLTILQ